jgi:hypothetical protein
LPGKLSGVPPNPGSLESYLLLVKDALHLVNGLVDLLLDLADLLFDLTGLAVRCALFLQVLIPGQVADGFLRLALYLICLSSHSVSPSSTS